MWWYIAHGIPLVQSAQSREYTVFFHFMLYSFQRIDTATHNMSLMRCISLWPQQQQWEKKVLPKNFMFCPWYDYCYGCCCCYYQLMLWFFFRLLSKNSYSTLELVQKSRQQVHALFTCGTAPFCIANVQPELCAYEVVSEYKPFRRYRIAPRLHKRKSKIIMSSLIKMVIKTYLECEKQHQQVLAIRMST